MKIYVQRFEYLLALVVLLLPLCNSSTLTSLITENESEGIALRFNDNIGCSYMGAWLAHINLLRKVPFYIDICRAEAASIEGICTASAHMVLIQPACRLLSISLINLRHLMWTVREAFVKRFQDCLQSVCVVFAKRLRGYAKRMRNVYESIVQRLKTDSHRLPPEFCTSCVLIAQ
jgi:hypothetical protein